MAEGASGNYGLLNAFIGVCVGFGTVQRQCEVYYIVVLCVDTYR